MSNQCQPPQIASAHLRRLRDLGLLEQKGRGNATYYIPTQKLLSPNQTPHTTPLYEGLTPHTSSFSGELPHLGQALTEKIQKIGKRTPPDTIKQIIKQLCSSRPFKLSEIALLLKRNTRYMRDYYLTPMVELEELELKFPDNPAHPFQAYQTKLH